MSGFIVSAIWRKMKKDLYHMKRAVGSTETGAKMILTLTEKLKLLEWKFSFFELQEVIDPVTNKKYLHFLNRENGVVEGIELEVPYQVSGEKELNGHVIVLPHIPAQENTGNTLLELVLSDCNMVNSDLSGNATLYIGKQPFKDMKLRRYDSGSFVREDNSEGEFKGRFKVVKEDDTYEYWGAVIDEEASDDYGTIFIPVYKSKPETSSRAKGLGEIWLERKYDMNSPEGQAWTSVVHLALEDNEITWLEHRNLLSMWYGC